MEFQSFASVMLDSPLFSGLLAAAIVGAGYRFFRWRADVPFWASIELMSEKQFDLAAARDEEKLLAAAERLGKRDFATAKLVDARRPHGAELKLGHLWWTWWQVRGLVGGHVPAPACTSDADGLAAQTKGRLDDMEASDLMRKW
jgi:hypothetical protein